MSKYEYPELDKLARGEKADLVRALNEGGAQVLREQAAARRAAQQGRELGPATLNPAHYLTAEERAEAKQIVEIMNGGPDPWECSEAERVSYLRASGLELVGQHWRIAKGGSGADNG